MGSSQCCADALQYLLRSKEYKTALRWLSWLLTERGDDPHIWSVVGYVQLMLGDINAADRTFQKAARSMSAVQSPQQQRQAQALRHQHQGLLLFARSDFPGMVSLEYTCAACHCTCTLFVIR